MIGIGRTLCVLALCVAATAQAGAPESPTTGPLISGPVYTPPAPDGTQATAITAKVTDHDAAIGAVTVTYTVGSTSPPVSVAALDDGAHGDGSAGDGIYGVLVPPQPPGTKVAFQVAATSASGTTTVTATRSYISARPHGPEYRAIWVDSWNEGILSTTQTRSLVDTCRAANINTIVPEVRKIGDACYKSHIEPRANNIAQDADFDPLADIIEQAHDTANGRPRMQVHPWFVMLRMQRDAGELDPRHVLAVHPEYEMLKSDGTHTKNRYLDPGHPGAVDHNVEVIMDCLASYDVDGIHLDYIRYPEYPGDWGYNPVSVARFNALHGRTGAPVPSDPAWSDWRRECVALQVRKIYVKAWQMKPHVVVSASTVNWGCASDDFERSSAYKQVFQDWVGWLGQGIVDYNCLMNYVGEDGTARFLGWTECSVAHSASRGSIVGVGAFLHSSIQKSLDQLLYVRSSGAAGMNIYDWGSEVDGNKKGETREQFYAELKRQVFPAWADPPVAVWKTGVGEGVFEGQVTLDGKPADHARVWIDGHPGTQTVTDGSGWYAILNVPAGTHRVRVDTKGMKPDAAPVEAMAQPGRVVSVNASLESGSGAGADGSM